MPSINYDRRHFLSTAVPSVAAAQLAVVGSADAQSGDIRAATGPASRQGRTRRSAR
jgi:hypothetical protein